MDKKQITIKIVNQYGRPVIYPVCDNAILFACLTGTKTLTRDAITSIKALGYTVKIEQQTL